MLLTRAASATVRRPRAAGAQQREQAEAVDTAAATAAVLAEMRVLADRAPGFTPRLLSLLERALAVVERQARESPPFSITLPLDVHACLGGSWPDAVPIAAAATWIYLGADVLDNLADHEVPPEWEGCTSDELVLAGATMTSALPLFALERLRLGGRSPRRLARLALRQAETLTEMAGGQLDDLSGDVADALAVVAAKSGAQAAGAAALVALLACPRKRCLAAAETIGRATGIALQLASDCHDLWRRRPSHDLANGRRTLPIAFGLATVAPEQETRLLRLLDAARTDSSRHDEAARLLADLGALRYTALRIDVVVRQGRAALAELEAHGHSPEVLRRRLGSLSVLA